MVVCVDPEQHIIGRIERGLADVRQPRAGRHEVDSHLLPTLDDGDDIAFAQLIEQAVQFAPAAPAAFDESNWLSRLCLSVETLVQQMIMLCRAEISQN